MEPLLFTFLLQSCRVGVVVLAIFLIRGLLGRRLSPTVRHALWLFAIAAMLLPLRIPIPVHETAKNLPVPETPTFPAPSFQEPRITPMPFLEPEIPDAMPQLVSLEMTPEKQSKTSRLPTFSQICFTVTGIWLGGVVFLFGMSVRQIVSFRRRIGDMKPITDEQTLSVLNDCRQKMRIAKTVGLLESDRIASPLLTGLFTPRILLPKRLSRSLTAEQLAHLLMHELAHVRRHDILTGWLLSLLGMVHWFNPLVVFAVRTANRDSEEAADALAITRMTPQGRIEYGMTLLHLAANRPLSPLPSVPGLAGILESSSKLSRRIEMIKRHKKTGRLAALLAVTFCTLACLGAFCQLKTVTAEETPKNDKPQAKKLQSNVAAQQVEGKSLIPVEIDKTEKIVSFKGHVFMPDGTPAKNATVHFEIITDDRAQFNLTNPVYTIKMHEGKTNESGKFELSSSFPVKETPVVMAGHAELLSETKEPLPFATKTVVFDNPDKELLEHDFMLVDAFPVTGTVRYPDGSPAKQFPVSFKQAVKQNTDPDLPYEYLRNAITDMNGLFKIYLFPGEYRYCADSRALGLMIGPDGKILPPINRSQETTVVIESDKPLELGDIALPNPPEEETTPPKKKPESAALKKFDMDKYVPIRERVIVPEGKTLERASLLMRALTSDNELGLYGSNESIQSDGTFLMQAHANANYEIVVKDRENPTLTSKTYRLEVGDEAPKEEIVIPLFEATAMIEGQVIDAQTGKPIPEMGLTFCQYFEIDSKNDGKTLIWPLSYHVTTDRNGIFRQGVLPGNYAVSTESTFMDIFFNPRTGYPKNYWTTSWDENKPTTSTAFQVKEGETIKPIMRIPHDSKDIQKDIEIHGKIIIPDGQKLPENIRELYVRILTHDNNTNYGMDRGIVRPDGSFMMAFKSNMNYEMTVYDANNEWAAKPIYVEVGPDTPSDEYEITLEKGTLIEGTAIDHATGKPLANTLLIFFEYFEVNSKTTGEKRRYPINSPLVTDGDGKFRRSVLPGLYGVSTEMAATSLFMPSTIEKLTVTDSAEWEKNEERQATAFEVKPNGETVRPILRIAK